MSHFVKTSEKVSDEDLIRSLLYCFQGVDSSYVVFNRTTKEFEVNSKLDFYQTDKCNRLMELGYLHRIVQEYIDKNSNNKNGSVASGVASCLHTELCIYYNSISELQKELEDSCENSKSYFLGNILCWSVLWLGQLQDLAHTVKLIEDSKHGGELVSVITPFAFCANPFLRQMAINMIKIATRPLMMMMCHWMVDGELLDPYDEFFISQRPGITNFDMWNNRYEIRESMVPAFFTKDIINSIFRTGRYINFLHTICGSKPELSPSREVLKELRNSGDKDLFPMLEQGSIISDMINKACTESSTMVLDILKEKFKLFLHFEGLRRYMLLGQGDFVTTLLEILQPHLDKPSGSHGSLMFQNFLDTAVRMSNAQHDDPTILKTLDVKLLLTSGEDYGWDIFQLNYSTDGPLETIFEFSRSGKYSIIFVFLWRLKRIDFVLSQMWRELKLLMKNSYYIVPEIRSALKLTNNLVAEMVHSIRQIQFYVLSDVIETEWEHFRQAINKATLLETVIDAHNKFLKNIFKRSMQTEESHDLSKKMRQLFESVLELRGIQEKFHSQSEYEMQRRKNLDKYIEVHGTCNEIENNDIELKEIFNYEVNNYETIIKDISNSYKTDLIQFLKNLIKISTDNEEALQSLANRINFNQYYSKNDQEIEKCATYVCRSQMSKFLPKGSRKLNK
ncbi:gamma-tubulin complex component 3-like [Daktulosphaira vitifoliae]|uniref:gamma-tubulin complex component 3-like n=1 Tax=Daktulosphaira vitifoliae TaxID=58002 RepID=UPI0021A9B167|nr:gamma-tubulin complex component 3-like [Daktulosphaira vitifoliae]